MLICHDSAGGLKLKGIAKVQRFSWTPPTVRALQMNWE